MEENNINKNGVRLRNEFLTLEYRADKPLLRSIGKKTHHLAKMCQQRRRDGDFLLPEAALFLAEQGAAVVVDQKGRKPMALARLYSILVGSTVSMLKYAVFTQLVRAGYVVRRPWPQTADEESLATASSSTNFPLQMCPFRFPKDLLDQFPCIVLSPDNRHAHVLHIPAIQRDGPLVNNGGGHEQQAGDEQPEKIELDIACLNGPMCERVKKAEPTLLRDLRRQAREPWVDCRPRWWPSLHAAHALDSWHAYAQRRAALMRQRRNGGKWQRRTRQNESTSPAYDYDVFPDERSASKPIYSVLIVEPSRFPDGHPDFDELYGLAEQCDRRGAPLLVATGTPTSVKISQFRAEPIGRLQVPGNGNEPIGEIRNIES